MTDAKFKGNRSSCESAKTPSEEELLDALATVMLLLSVGCCGLFGTTLMNVFFTETWISSLRGAKRGTAFGSLSATCCWNVVLLLARGIARRIYSEERHR